MSSDDTNTDVSSVDIIPDDPSPDTAVEPAPIPATAPISAEPSPEVTQQKTDAPAPASPAALAPETAPQASTPRTNTPPPATTEPGAQPDKPAEPKIVKLRCPFCHESFAPQKKNRCPHCHKFVMIPPTLKPGTKDESKKARPRIEKPVVEGGLVGILSQFTGKRKLPIMVGVVGILVVAGVMLVRQTENAGLVKRPTKQSVTVHNLTVLRTALEIYYRDCRRYPTTQESLKVLVRDMGIAGWRGPYITFLRTDSWFTAFRYENNKGNIILSSAGPDCRHGTRDDIKSPSPDLKMLASWDKTTEMTEYEDENVIYVPVRK